ncbi:class A beta-lactamase [Citricoccus sp. GCM10030269]|uniref:class A beta-lactamase n=1 Tax=Citricoccus sp. GCM10030269 TaxID=3273388 RepID=UPI00360DD760
MRTSFLLPVLLAPLLLTGCSPTAEAEPAASSASPTASTVPSTDGALADLEERFSGRVGVYAVDTGTGEEVQYRADERFGYASTHKVFSAAAVLAQSEPADLEQRIHYSPEDLVANSPIAEQHVETGMTLEQIIGAAISHSDNTAGNLLFDALDGPEGLQAALAGSGDEITSVDREEPELNEWAPGETRDTTTPRQAAENLRGYALGDALEPWEQDKLLTAMRASENSEGLIRAAVPEGASWTVANKSGAGLGHGTRNDLAVIERAEGAPLVVAVYTNLDDPEGTFQDEFVAEAATVAVEELT